MNKYAIFHITNVPYAYAKDKDTLTVRVRTASNDIDICRVYYKCRYDWVNPFDMQEMKLEAHTELFDYFQADLSVPRNRYRYFFEFIDKEGQRFFLDERGLRENDVEIREAAAFQYAYIAESDVYEECKWMQEAVIYQIFPDRFCNGNRKNDPENVSEWGQEVTPASMYGGDLQGIIDKLDYIQELGINLIYLTPIFKSSSNHKYNTTDYFEIDPLFGSLETARKLVKKCHEKGIRIIFDAVFNHSGSDFFAFKDVLKNQENSQYKDWFFIDEYPVDTEKVNYYTFAQKVPHMPKLNIANPEVKEYLLQVGEYWVKEIDIDGWRLDVGDEVPHEFWKAFRKRIRAVNNEAVIIGEIMHEAGSFLAGDELDSIMNYPFKGAVVDFFAKRTINESQFDNIITNNRVIYMNSITRQLWNLLGSHDTMRFLTECEGKTDRLKLAAAFQFTYMGVPYIYYGDEVGLDGGNDPLCRRCMIWDEEKQNKELLQHYKTLVSVRKENKALVYGDYHNVYLKDNVIVFKRTWGSETMLIAINNNDSEYTIEANLAGKAKDVISREEISLEGGLTLDKMGNRIFKINE